MRATHILAYITTRKFKLNIRKRVEELTVALRICWELSYGLSIFTLKVQLAPKFFSAEMKLCNIRIKNFIILSVSGIFKGFKNWQKVAEICYQLVRDRASRGLALFLI